MVMSITNCFVSDYKLRAENTTMTYLLTLLQFGHDSFSLMHVASAEASSVGVEEPLPRG